MKVTLQPSGAVLELQLGFCGAALCLGFVQALDFANDSACGIALNECFTLQPWHGGWGFIRLPMPDAGLEQLSRLAPFIAVGDGGGVFARWQVARSELARWRPFVAAGVRWQALLCRPAV